MVISYSILEELLLKFPNENWDWSNLLYRKSISLEFIETYIDLPWNWKNILNNPNATLEFYEKWKHIKPISPTTLFYASHFNTPKVRNYIKTHFSEIIVDYVRTNSGRFKLMCSIQNLNDFNFIKSNIHSFSIHFVCKSLAVTPNIIEQNPDIPWRWKSLSRHKNMTLDFVKKNTEKEWDWGLLSINKNIATPENIEQNLDLPWNWEMLSRDAPLWMYEKYLTKPWSFERGGFSMNPNVTISFVKKYLDRDWCWSYLSVIIPFRDIVRNITLRWNWRYVSFNKTVTVKIIQNYKLPWSYVGLSSNRNLSREFIFKNIDKMDFQLMSRHNLNKYCPNKSECQKLFYHLAKINQECNYKLSCDLRIYIIDEMIKY